VKVRGDPASALSAAIEAPCRRRGGGTGRQDSVPEEVPELLLPDPEELPECVHPFAMDDGGAPLTGGDLVEAPEEPDEPDDPDEPEELVEDPEVDDDRTAVEPVVDDFALVEAPAMDIPTPKLSPKAPRAAPAARTGLLCFIG
jgi:hypothetical protein